MVGKHHSNLTIGQGDTHEKFVRHDKSLSTLDQQH